MVSRLDSAPTVAPLPPGAPVAPGAKPTPAGVELLAEAAAAPAWPPPGVKLGKNPTVKNFEEFWKPFRAALLASDTDTVAKATRFPFRARSDSDPERFPASALVERCPVYAGAWRLGQSKRHNRRPRDEPDEWQQARKPSQSQYVTEVPNGQLAPRSEVGA